jgi:hypothetical protein
MSIASSLDFDQGSEIGADHRVLAGRLGHAFEPRQLLAGLLLDLLGHLRLFDRPGEPGDLLRLVVGLAQLLLDGAELLAQQILALTGPHRLLRLLADVARQAQHLDAVGEQPQHAVKPAVDVDRLQHLLLLGRLEVHGAGDEVGELTGRGGRLDRGGEFGRRVRDETQRLGRALLQLMHARFDLGAAGLLLLDQLDAGDQIGIARQELAHAEALLALADQMMTPVGTGQIAQHAGAGADLVEIGGSRFVHLGIALQEDADIELIARGFLCRGDGALAPHRHRHDHAGKQHHVAHRDDDQRIGRQRRRGVRSCPALRLLRRRRRLLRLVASLECAHGFQPSLRSCRFRQPSLR